MALTPPVALASHIGEELETDLSMVASSNQLISLLRQYERMPEAQRAAMLPRLTLLAQQRQERMLALIDRNPKLAAVRALPGSVRARLPEQARAFVEQDVTVSGSVVAMVADDFARGRSSQRFYLVEAAGRQLDLRVANATERELLSMVGRRASVAGSLIERRLLAADKRKVQLLAADGTTSSSSTATTSTAPVLGDQSTLVIAANFTDQPFPCSTADLQQRLFGASGNTLDQGYRQSSGGLVSFSGQVIGPFTINFPSSGTCDSASWATALKSAAIAAGINPSSYKRLSYALPPNPSCGWTGLATLGGTSPTPSWTMSCSATGLFSHELGHNLKFHHAATPSSEYGDGTDPMGAARLVQSNAANRVMAGWLSGSQVLDVTSGGSYTLASLESSAAGAPQVLRMYKPDTAEYYYVSLRQPVGVDGNLATSSHNAISVHRSAGALPAKTYLLATLALGQSWNDSINGVLVSHLALSGSLATVGITLNGATCSRLPPTVTLSPPSQSAAAGSTLGYTVTLSNNNSPACPVSSFALGQTVPAGFSGSFATNSVSLAPGGSTNVAWNVASATSVVEATFTLTAVATDAMGSASSDAHASYVVLAAPAPTPPPTDTTPPGLAITSPGAGTVLSGRYATITADASDASGVRVVEFYIDGKLLGTSSGAPYGVNWNLRKAGKGAHTVLARAVDAVGNASEKALSVTVK